MHPRLAAHMEQSFGSVAAAPESVREFIALVEQAYFQADQDRALLECSREELERAVSLIGATLDSTTDGILVVDSAGTIVQMNARFRELWRIPDSIARERDDRLALDFVLGQLVDPERFVQKVRELYDQADAESFDELLFKDGRIFERYSRPQRIGGRTVGRVWSFRDVTSRRALEDELRQSQKLDAVGALAGGIAHDFNNMLTVIRGHAELIEVGGAADCAADVKEILLASDRAAKLTAQLLAFSRRQMLQPVVLDLNDVVMRIAPTLHRLLGDAFEVVLSLAPALARVSADPEQLAQVIHNLVVNARDAMPRGGRIEIRTRDITVDVGARVELAVKDMGKGLTREQAEHIFEPFFTTKELGSGKGLGLATVFGIVAQSGGKIEVDSQPGAGSTFRITFPSLGTVASTLRDAPVPRLVTTRGKTILLAEDEQTLRMLVQRMLEREGYTVVSAANGKDALELLAAYSGTVDLVLTDMIMPHLGGVELGERVGSMRPGTPVLLMSGYAASESDRAGLASGQIPFLGKPFSGAQLLASVREALAKEGRAG